MPRVDLPIADGFYEDFSLPVAAQSCINLQPSFSETSTGVRQQHLIGTPRIYKTSW